MTDDELRALLRQAHAADAPPPFAAPRARRRLQLRPLLVVAAAAALVAFIALRPRPPAVAIAVWTAPTDFLLDVPGSDLLRTVPRFELKGTLP